MVKKTALFIVALLVFLTIFFNIELINLGEPDGLGVHPFVYVLTISSVVAVILIPFVRRQRVWILLICGFVLYALGKLLFFPPKTTVDWVIIYVIGKELFFYLISVALSSQVAHYLFELEYLVENAIAPKTNRRVYSLDKAEPIIQVEFSRGRRNRYPISTLIIEPAVGVSSIPEEVFTQAAQEIQQALAMRFVVARLAETISQHTRQIDLVVDLDQNGRFMIVCPGTSAENSVKFGRRLQAVAKESLGINLSFGSASFPDEALTFEAILNKAEDKLTQVIESPVGTRIIDQKKI